MLIFVVICVLASPLISSGVTAACYFATELQGEFITQSTVTHANEVIYSRVNITEDSIPIWGLCHRRIDSNIILRIDSDESSCYRCFSLHLVSRNVLRVYTTEKDYISKCYTNEEKAIESCPTADNLRDNAQHKEIILYKISEANGDDIQRQYCPFNGRYKVSYSIDDGTSEPIACDGEDSEIDNCPSGSAINIRFRKCTFENYETTLECLGSWTGYGNQNYVAFLNKGSGFFGPQYRCATYNRNEKTGIVTISFSSDSMCTFESSFDQSTDHAQHMQTIRSETMTLFPADDHSLWSKVNQYCTIPDWMHGEYEHLSINGKQIVYRDQASFKTYTMECVHLRDDASASANQQNGKMLTYSRTQCGEEQYHCVWLSRRSANILEFQVGSKTMQHNALHDKHDTDIESICDDTYFDHFRWLTQSRVDTDYQVTSCPIDGQFVGQLPDVEGLCARLWSDCKRPDVMYYQVSSCEYGEIYEEREYQCIGQWSEGNIVYAYTRRTDVPTFECFAGAMDINEEIFLKEAGENCQRNADPYRYGMQMNQTTTCAQLLDHQPPSAGTSPNSHHDKPVSIDTNAALATSVTGSIDPKKSNHVNDTSSDMSRPTLSIGYDYFDENRSLAGTPSEPRFNETVQFVNIKRVNSYDNNNVIESESDANDLRITTPRSSNPKRPHLTTGNTIPRYDTPTYDYNRSASVELSKSLVMLCVLLIAMYRSNLY